MKSSPTCSYDVRWARVFAALFLLFALSEAGSRLLIWEWSGKPYRSLALYLWSPYGLVRNNPDVNSPSFQINRNGFRDRKDYTLEKPPHTLRVLLMGGSVLYSGLGGVAISGVERVDSDHTISQYLAKELLADPALAGLNVEVLNASENYNRIVEVSVAYLAEYIHWQPDVVIVCGSANNFGYAPSRGDVVARRFIIQRHHPWELEFQRLVNYRGLSALCERFFRGVEEHSATLALVSKAEGKAIDVSIAKVDELARRLKLNARAPESLPYADFAEYDLYVTEYLAYADAVVAAARRRNQEVAFFWEYFIAHLNGIKPFSDTEKFLYRSNRLESSDVDAKYDEYARTKVREFCRANKAAFLDPGDALRLSNETIFIDYLHYTKEGNRFMARFMYEQLKPIFDRRAQNIRSMVGAE
jgi:lysophospholipase L1-like esterase